METEWQKAALGYRFVSSSRVDDSLEDGRDY
jgi:hypothetical protein